MCGGVCTVVDASLSSIQTHHTNHKQKTQEDIIAFLRRGHTNSSATTATDVSEGEIDFSHLPEEEQLEMNALAQSVEQERRKSVQWGNAVQSLLKLSEAMVMCAISPPCQQIHSKQPMSVGQGHEVYLNHMWLFKISAVFCRTALWDIM